MPRNKDTNWNVQPGFDGKFSLDAVSVCLLMDIRDELKKFNAVIDCPNFLGIPRPLQQIRRNTARKRKAGVRLP